MKVSSSELWNHIDWQDVTNVFSNLLPPPQVALSNRSLQTPLITPHTTQCTNLEKYNVNLLYIYLYMFQNVFLRCPTPRLHCFLSSHWPSFRFLSFMAFLIPSIQFFFGLPHALFCFGIHFNAILGNLPSAILWTWPYHVSWFCSISFYNCFL